MLHCTSRPRYVASQQSTWLCASTGSNIKVVRAARLAEAQPAVCKSVATQELSELAAASGTKLFHVDVRSQNKQRGIYATEDITKDTVLMQIPLSACLVIDDDDGVTLPQAEWPIIAAMAAAAEQSEAPPPSWDIVLALALLDAKNGSSDSFTQFYVDAFLPTPQQLSTPFCQSAAGLAALQHPRVADAALKRRELLEEQFPEHSRSFIGGTDTTELQWALACIRSRAFQLSTTHFAQVPFADLLNHSPRPCAALRPRIVGRTAGEGNGVEVVATQDVAAGAEVTMSYTGAQGATNRQLLVQYGFVLPRSESDRLDLELFKGYVTTTPLRGAPGAALSLSRLQARIGDEIFQKMLSGEEPYLLGALKSIPTYSMEAEEMPNPGQLLKEESSMVDKLQGKLDAIDKEFTTTLEADEELLASGPQRSAWEETALQYRIERKRLARAANQLLQMYREVIEAGL